MTPKEHKEKLINEFRKEFIKKNGSIGDKGIVKYEDLETLLSQAFDAGARWAREESLGELLNKCPAQYKDREFHLEFKENLIKGNKWIAGYIEWDCDCYELKPQGEGKTPEIALKNLLSNLNKDNEKGM